MSKCAEATLVTFAYIASIAATAGFVVLGVFEILTAQNNSPQNTHLTGYGINAYAFTVTKAVINMIISFFMVCTVGGASCVGCKGAVNDNREMTEGGGIGALMGAAIVFAVGLFISFDVNIWGLIVWFNFKDDTPNPYVDVFYAEMIVSFIFVALCGSVCLIGCCGACCGLWSSDVKSSNNGIFSHANHANRMSSV